MLGTPQPPSVNGTLVRCCFHTHQLVAGLILSSGTMRHARLVQSPPHRRLSRVLFTHMSTHLLESALDRRTLNGWLVSPTQVDQWYHGAGKQECGVNAPGDWIVDFSNSTGVHVQAADVYTINGTYTTELLTSEAERLIHSHAAAARSSGSVDPPPLYMYVRPRWSVHSDDSVYVCRDPSIRCIENVPVCMYAW